MRCAIFFVPACDDPLTIAGARWLRRDPYSGARVNHTVEGLTDADHAFLTALPRRYGLHATLKAPFRLADGHGVSDLQRRLDEFCTGLRPVSIACQISFAESVFAFLPDGHDPAIDTLAARVVAEFDGFRSPLTEIDLAHRNVSRLNGRQLSNLMNWGHPNVFDEYRFHMTLTGPIDHLERDHVATVLHRHFGGLAAHRVLLDQLVLAVEPEPHAPFVVHSTHQFGLADQLRSA